MTIKKLIVLVSVVLLFTNCADKQDKIDDNFNKSATHWYKQIIKNIKSGTLDKADEAYTSLSSEHVASPLLKEAILILAEAHSENDEHLLAHFYIDTYIQRYAKSTNIEYLKYLKLKSNFKALKKAKRDQKLVIDTINNANGYIKKFPNSSYNPLVHTMLTKLYLAELVLDRDIANLYERTGKKTAAKIYKDKIASSWLKNTEIDLSSKSILDKVFE
jgi:outer membrane protein assembly factor BamD